MNVRPSLLLGVANRRRDCRSLVCTALADLELQFREIELGHATWEQQGPFDCVFVDVEQLRPDDTRTVSIFHRTSRPDGHVLRCVAELRTVPLFQGETTAERVEQAIAECMNPKAKTLKSYLRGVPGVSAMPRRVIGAFVDSPRTHRSLQDVATTLSASLPYARQLFTAGRIPTRRAFLDADPRRSVDLDGEVGHQHPRDQ